MNIPIFVGTVMGTSLNVAETISKHLQNEHHTTHLIAQFEPSEYSLENCDLALVCTSNTGMGDLPANIQPLYRHLTTDLPRIAGLTFAIISLGDSSYPNFAQAGQTLEHAFLDLGAKRIGEHKILDALLVEDYQVEALTWAQQLSQLLQPSQER